VTRRVAVPLRELLAKEGVSRRNADGTHALTATGTRLADWYGADRTLEER